MLLLLFVVFPWPLGYLRVLCGFKISILFWISGHPFVVISDLLFPVVSEPPPSTPLRWHLPRLTLYPGTCSPCTGKNCIVQPDKLHRKWRRVLHTLSDSLFSSCMGWLPRGDVRVSRYTVDAPFLLSALPVIVKLWSGPLFCLTTGLLYLLGELVVLEIPRSSRQAPCFEVCVVSPRRSCPGPSSLMFTCCILSPTFCFQTFFVLLCKVVSCFFLLLLWWFVYFFMQSLTVLHWSV